MTLLNLLPDPRPNDPDQPLVEQALRGDLRSFEALVERHQDVVFRLAARIVGPHEAEDISQDTFLRAYHRLPRFRGESSFRTWLLQIAHNAAINAAVRKRPEPVSEPLQDESRSGVVDQRMRQPAVQLEARERQQRLMTKLEVMRPSYRALIVLRDLEGFSYEEVAEILDMPVGSVKGRLHRARDEMIGLLRNNTYDWDLPA